MILANNTVGKNHHNLPNTMLSIKRKELANLADEGLLPVYKSYGLISAQQYHILRDDIIYLFLDNIADMIQLVFTLEESEQEQVLLKFKITENGIFEVNNALNRGSKYHSDDIVLEMYIDFTESFQALDKDVRRMLLNNTQLEWHKD